MWNKLEATEQGNHENKISMKDLCWDFNITKSKVHNKAKQTNVNKEPN